MCRPLQCVLQREAAFHRPSQASTLTHKHTHTHSATSSPSLFSSCPTPPHPTCIINPRTLNPAPSTPHPPSVFPARAPMSKPNTTDQQLDMQIVSRDKLCAACQPHTWALGWLSVTCVRVPLRLRCTTLMTGCRVSLRCTPPLRLPPTTFYPFNHSPTTSTHPHHPLITSDETVCHLCEGGSLKKMFWSSVLSMWIFG